jgi:sugar lactone lactonase YvrE
MLGGAREQDAFDAAIDAEGGVWVVGKFIEQLVVRDPDGTVVTALETEENESDGFVLRFRPPGE